MLTIISKILRVHKNIIPVNTIDYKQTEIITLGKKIHNKIIHLFHGSLAIRQIDGGSDNACEQELVALSNSFYDIERFGIHFVASPRHADMLLVTGPITRNMASAVLTAFHATPTPKIVVTVGDDANDEGLFKNCYAVSGRVSDIIPVHYHIPGDPPTPKDILYHLLRILEKVDCHIL